MSTRKVVELPRRTVSSVSPLTGELLREFEQHSDDVVEKKIALAAATFREYRKISFAQRATMMLRAAEILEKEKDSFGRMMTQEMGKTLKSAVQEAEKSAFGCATTPKMRNALWPMKMPRLMPPVALCVTSRLALCWR
jgi:acyl-CoA reductase-like NAD-dependent aldehyde dehydrogenase